MSKWTPNGLAKFSVGMHVDETLFLEHTDCHEVIESRDIMPSLQQLLELADKHVCPAVRKY